MPVLTSSFHLDQRALRAIRMGEDALPFLEEIAAIREDELHTALKDVKHRRAFWINLYNGFALLALERKPDLKGALTRIRHFSDRAFVVGYRVLLLHPIDQ